MLQQYSSSTKVSLLLACTVLFLMHKKLQLTSVGNPFNIFRIEWYFSIDSYLYQISGNKIWFFFSFYIFRYENVCNKGVYLIETFIFFTSVDYLVQFLLYFHWVINIWRGKGGSFRNCMQKCILSGNNEFKLNFVVTVKWFVVSMKPSQVLPEDIEYYGWQTRCLKNSIQWILLSGCTQMQRWAVTVLFTVLCGSCSILHLQRNSIVSV